MSRCSVCGHLPQNGHAPDCAEVRAAIGEPAVPEPHYAEQLGVDPAPGFAVPEAPALPEGWVEMPREKLCYDKAKDVEAISLDDLRALLVAQELSIIGAKDKAVLEACAALTIGMPSCAPRPPAKMGPIPKAGVMAVVEAELARREKP